MLSVSQRIVYVLDTTRLDVVVKLASSGANGAQRHLTCPWLTLCAEPVSRTVLASHLHPDPPNLSTMCSLLYQAVAPSKEHPHGRMPDELWADRSVLFSGLRQKGFLEQIDLPLGQIPFSSKGIPERLFGTLRADLQRDFPAPQCDENVFEEDSLPLFSDIEQWCKQWVISSQKTVQDQQRHNFLTYCETQWQTRSIDVAVLDRLLEGPWSAHVTCSGIEYRGAIYWHPTLDALCNRDVAIRTIVSYLPPSHIEVFVQDRWVCSAPFISWKSTV